MASTNLMADTVFGVYAGAQVWYYDNSGKVTTPLNIIPFTSEINTDKESSLSFYVAIEHGVPLLPNLKLKNSDINAQFINQLDVCPPENPCNSAIDIDLGHTDLSLYYELLDNWINLDLGLSALSFDGNNKYSNLHNYSSADYSEVIPALYGKAEFEFPTTDISASLTANVGTFTNDTFVDLELAASYKFALGFSIEAGLRKQTVDFEYSNNVKIDSTSTGVFAALNFHF